MKQDMLQQVLEQKKTGIFKQLVKVYKVEMGEVLPQHPKQFKEIPGSMENGFLGKEEQNLEFTFYVKYCEFV